MAVVESPPINIPLIDQNGNISERWHIWFESVDTKIAAGGGTGGEFLGDTNTGYTITTSDDANIYINGLKLNEPTAENQIAVSSGSEITWISTEDLAATPTGTIRPYIDDTLPAGWVLLDDGTIGSAASGATNRANADTETLYKQIWDGISDTYAPVTGGRGGSAQADFDADKPIQLATIAGRVPKVMAGVGTLGTTNGAETSTMTENMVPEHHHTYDARQLDGGGDVTTDLVVDEPRQVSGDDTYNSDFATDDALAADKRPIGTAGSGDAQDIMQPTVHFKMMIKL